ncbi:MAG: TonB-dependent receptor, partial [Pseudohongiellaceae bacterium]
LMLLCGGGVFAATETQSFSIPEQPIRSALLEFAQQSRMSILFPGDVFSGIRANSLNGDYDVESALEILLQGTGIEVTIRYELSQIIVQLDPTNGGSGDDREVTDQGRGLNQSDNDVLSEAGNSAISVNTSNTRLRQSSQIEEITITGSRIRRTDGMTTAVPVTVVTREELAGFAPASTLAEQMDTLPQFFQTQTAQRGGTTFLDASGSYLNLRGMGSSRTLVLFDGSRTVPADRQGAVNVDNLPTALISTVDVVTGGASAAYGADALAGVVNFVLDREFEGITGSFSTGLTERGDGENWHLSLASGTQISDGLNVIASVEARRINQIYRDPRSLDNWNSIGWVSNPDWYPDAPAGIPKRLTLPDVHSTLHTPAGMINQPGFMFDRYTFTADGKSVRPFIPGDVTSWENQGATNTQSGGPEADIAE